jgi:hypothetical protein
LRCIAGFPRSVTRFIPRLALAGIVAVAVPILSACDYLDNLTLWDSKKPLAGERKSLFPQGVPGVATGVPSDLMKGYREPEGQAPADPARAAAEAAAAEHAPAAKPKPKPPQRTAVKPPPPADPNAAPPARQAAAPPSAPPFAAPQSAPMPWPTAPPSSTVAR